MDDEYKHEPPATAPATSAERELRAVDLERAAFHAYLNDRRDAALWLPPLAAELLALGFAGASHPFQICLTAAQRHRSDALRILLDMGFSPPPESAESDLNWPGLLKACAINGLCEPIERLLRTMHVDTCGPTGLTALICAAANRREETALLLLSLGADPNARSSEGYTPIMSAAIGDSPAIIHAMLRLGADPHALDDHGKTAMDHARKHRATHFPFIMEALEIEASLPPASPRRRASL